MHGVLGKAGTIASKANDKSAVEKTIDDKSDEDWFAEATTDLFPNGKAGTALHYDTGFDERSCQRYASGQVKPPAYFLRSLLRSEKGWTWLCVVMDGSDAEWWREVWIARECAIAFEVKRRELEASQGQGNEVDCRTRR